MASTRRRHAGAAAAAAEWAAVSGAGAWRVEAVGKLQLMRRTGLPARDLRALDPALSYPSSIMGRDRAVVVNLERVRAVITATEVLVPDPRDPAVAPLVRELRARLMATPAPAAPLPQVSLRPRSPRSLPPASLAVSLGLFPEAKVYLVFTVEWKEDEAAENGGALPPAPGVGGEGKDDQALGRDKALPFEFRALEVCLEFACNSLEQEVQWPACCPVSGQIAALNCSVSKARLFLQTCTLEEEAYPALDELSSNVSTLNLERVRQIKSRLVAISGRVQKVIKLLDHHSVEVGLIQMISNVVQRQ